MSPLKSPTATELGPDPTGKLVAGAEEGGRHACKIRGTTGVAGPR
jgi:hypothetical protein